MNTLLCTIKAAAAARYHALSVRPETAQYLFNRFTNRRDTAVTTKVARLVESLRPVVTQQAKPVDM